MPPYEEPFVGPAHDESESAIVIPEFQLRSLDQDDLVEEMSGYIKPSKMGDEHQFEEQEQSDEVPEGTEVSEEGR